MVALGAVARALGRVAPADAADASGVLVTVVQLGQVVGVALPGTLFLSRVVYPATAARSGHALADTLFVTALALLAAVAFAARTGRAPVPPAR
ncbi:hypothetical protein ACIQGZ_17965 [Streptomyces sp. NPDC092296]|uniref:hypothetical protein n=1 Tax=Streptomyces sp. NPDC092296 TaxID=3366012 RepID=UPI0037FA25DB